MSRFSRMRGEAGRLERDLRAGKPEPRGDFLLGLSKNMAVSTPRSPRRASRVAFAMALVTFMVGSFASFGGLSYAASGAASAASAVKHVVASDHRRALQSSSAKAQYGSPPTGTSEEQGTAGETAGAGQVAGAQSSSLPFTGMSLLVTALLGFSMLTAGLLLRWREQRQKS
jgi:hypothetical protein